MHLRDGRVSSGFIAACVNIAEMSLGCVMSARKAEAILGTFSVLHQKHTEKKKKKKEAIISFYLEVVPCGQPVEEMQERARVVSFRNFSTVESDEPW